MIIFKIEEFIPHVDKFKLGVAHENNLKFYIKQYETVLMHLNQTALKRQYRLNSMSYPYLFLLRHYSELKLKGIIEERGFDFPETHEFAALYLSLPDIPDALKKAISHIDIDQDGSCYRYIFDKYGNPGPLHNSRIEFLPFFLDQNEIPPDGQFNFQLGISGSQHPRVNWDLTFHFNSIESGQFRSTYDEMSSYLIEEVIAGHLDVNDIYLPLLFIIRHSLELAFKDSLSGLLHTLNEPHFSQVKRAVANEHSLKVLFKKLSLSLPADISGLTGDYQEQYPRFTAQSEKLKGFVNLLDKNSRKFRYPDPQHNLAQSLTVTSLVDVISDFLEVDVFLTFNVDVLKYEGIIPFTDEEMARLVGYDPNP